MGTVTDDLFVSFNFNAVYILWFEYFLSTSSYYYKSKGIDALFNDILNFISSESKTKKNLPDIFQARIIIGA